MWSKIIGVLIFSSILVIGSQKDFSESSLTLEANTGISEILESLGDNSLTSHLPDLSMRGVSAEKGKEIITQGHTTRPNGGQMSRISVHFECIACHNIEREDPTLYALNPDERLNYTAENNLPFLQGTTLYGIFNRTSFYNGDYKKKYGVLVVKARENIREAIQLCSTECSQGRKMKKWEVESVLAYLQTIELKLGDLELDDEEAQLIASAIDNGANKELAIEMIKSKYAQYSPATFIDPPTDRKVNVNSANISNGQKIYETGCLHCHENERYSFFQLDNSELTFKYLANNSKKYNEHSFYQVSRYGTKPKTWKKAYMPQYTKERMSESQMKDLHAYIKKMAK